MRNFIFKCRYRSVVFFVVAVFFVSCKSTPTKTIPPKKIEIPPTPESILGKGIVTEDKLVKFLMRSNPNIEADFAAKFARMYIKESKDEGVNHDIAFSQMCLETGFLSFGGLVTPEMHNYCGLGSIGPGQNGEVFPTPEIGIRAQIQHLKAYATAEPPKKEVVDPRRRWVRYGSAPTISALSGSWAADREYDRKIRRILDKLYSESFGF